MIKAGIVIVNRVGRILDHDRTFLKIAGLKRDEAKWHYIVDMLRGVDRWNMVRDSEKDCNMMIHRRNRRDYRYVVSCSKIDQNRWNVSFSKA